MGCMLATSYLPIGWMSTFFEYAEAGDISPGIERQARPLVYWINCPTRFTFSPLTGRRRYAISLSILRSPPPCRQARRQTGI